VAAPARLTHLEPEAEAEVQTQAEAEAKAEARLSAAYGGTVASAGEGTFAAAVLDLLADGRAGERFRRVPDPADLWSDAVFSARPDALVLITDAMSDDAAESADEAAHHSRIPWLGVEVEHQRATVGPLVVPGQGPCHACFRRRRMQHDPQWPLTRALRAARVREEALRPRGFLPHHPRMVAGVVAMLLGSAAGRMAAAGSVVTVQFDRSTVTRDMVVGCHGCARCGTSAAQPGRDLGTLLADRLRAAATGRGERP
jgi:bacteriocin biosynthesis cyclodehydratase domain-containing protein